MIAALPLDFVSSFETLLFPGRAKSRTFLLQYLIGSKSVQRQNTGLCLQPLVKWFGYAGFYLILGFISPLQHLFIVTITALFRLQPTLSLMSVPIINEVALPLYNKKKGRFTREKCLD